MEKHIICGTSAAATLRQYLKLPADSVIMFPDDLSLGPLVPIKSNVDEFIARRKEFWQSNSYDPDLATYLVSDLEKFIPAIVEAKKLTLWLGPGACEQFMWAWLTHIFEIYKIDWGKIQVRHLFNEYRRKFISLGGLNPEQFALCQNFEFNKIHITALYEAYAALSEPTPDKIIEISGRAIAPLPDLQSSIKAYFKEYPDYKTGLPIFDKAMLSACADKRYKSARIVAYGMMSDEYDNRLGICDQYLFHRLIKLSLLKNPLIELFGTVKDSSSMRFTEVAVTETGQKVLNGKMNQIDLNGVDEYIGGVHLSSERNTALWLYKDGSLINAPVNRETV